MLILFIDMMVIINKMLNELIIDHTMGSREYVKNNCSLI